MRAVLSPAATVFVPGRIYADADGDLAVALENGKLIWLQYAGQPYSPGDVLPLAISDGWRETILEDN